MPDPPKSKGESSAQPARPTLLKPPSTIISPPSPVDLKADHSAMFCTPPQPHNSAFQPSSSPEDETHVEYDSPTSDDDMPIPALLSPPPSQAGRPRAASDEMGSMPVAATAMSSSPQGEFAMLHPESPSASSSPLPRSPSPSSPHYRPRGLHHRRTSSTHRVRETMDGEQREEGGERMVNQYKIGRALGRGAFAKVELAVDVSDGKQYAIKEFSKSRLQIQALQERQRQNARKRKSRGPGASSPKPSGDDGQGGDKGPWSGQGTKTLDEDPLGLIRREIAVMKKLDHPNLVSLYEAISVPNADALFLVLEYMPGGVLMSVHLGQDPSEASPPFDLSQTREYFRQLCLGLEYLHENGVVHRDIKPDNILLSDNREEVKLCDFGVSEMFMAQGDDRIKKSGGSPAFLSPESFTSHTHELHGKAVDIWSLGVTLYCMLTGALPFNVTNPMELFEVVRTKDPPIPEDWDSRLKDLIMRMFKKDPEERIVMSDLREHDWVTDSGKLPMIPTDENLYDVGKRVEEPTQEELGNAIGSFKGVFTVIRAIQKMRRLQVQRRLSGQGSLNMDMSGGGSMDSYGTTDTGLDTEPQTPPRGMSMSTDPTSAEGDPEPEKEGGDTHKDESEGEAEGEGKKEGASGKGKEEWDAIRSKLRGDEEEESRGTEERESSAETVTSGKGKESKGEKRDPAAPKDKLKPIETSPSKLGKRDGEAGAVGQDGEEGEGGDGVILCDSPTDEDEEEATPVREQGER